MAPAQVLTTTIHYHPGLTHEDGFDVHYPGTAGNYRRRLDAQTVQITDIRGSEADFSLDKQGFQIINYPMNVDGVRITKRSMFDAISAGRTKDDPASNGDGEESTKKTVKDVIYETASGLLKKVTGASRVLPFSHVIRDVTWESVVSDTKDLKDRDPISINPPARFAHVDQSYNGARSILEDQLTPEEATRLSRTRWGIINVWRPLNKLVRRDPMAVCDARSVPESDLVQVSAVLPPNGANQLANVSKKGFENWFIKANENHRWYCVDGMTPDEALLIKCFDSKMDGRARRSPHSAFVDPRPGRSEGPPRESMEIRCLVFWEDEDAE